MAGDKRLIVTAKHFISGVAIQPIHAFGSVGTLEAAEQFADRIMNTPNWSVEDILYLNRLMDFGTANVE